MGKALFFGFCLVTLWSINRPVKASSDQLNYGHFAVGFRILNKYDSTRIYQLSKGITYPLLSIHVWYPAENATIEKRMPYGSYIRLETQRGFCYG